MNKFTEKIKKHMCNCMEIIKDTYSHYYLMSEHQESREKYNLGSGAFSSAISLFAVLNYLSKMYSILKYGHKYTVNQSDIDLFEQCKQKLKEADLWNQTKRFIKKPQLGEMNETEAFTRLICDCDINFGFDKSKKEEIKKIWSNFRNKLTHTTMLAGDANAGQMLIIQKIELSREGRYSENLNFLKSRSESYLPFDIVSNDIKTVFVNNNEISTNVKQFILKDKCYIESLNLKIEDLINWILNEIESEKYIENHEILINWISKQISESET
jgi:hypothetical protein